MLLWTWITLSLLHASASRHQNEFGPTCVGRNDTILLVATPCRSSLGFRHSTPHYSPKSTEHVVFANRLRRMSCTPTNPCPAANRTTSREQSWVAHRHMPVGGHLEGTARTKTNRKSSSSNDAGACMHASMQRCMHACNAYRCRTVSAPGYRGWSPRSTATKPSSKVRPGQTHIRETNSK